MTVYFISGLGADKRAFQKLVLPQNWNIQHLEWITPLQNESLASYCKRFSKYIDTKQNFILVGLSFGGIVAVELNKIVQPKLTILISSIATKQELPLDFKLFGKLKFDKIIPEFLLNKVYLFTYWYFGVKAKEEKRLLKQIITDTSASFLKWSIHEILNWKNTERPPGLIHIHGTNDHIFSINKTKADIKIAGGGHLMVYDKAEIISKILIKKITELNSN